MYRSKLGKEAINITSNISDGDAYTIDYMMKKNYCF